MEAASANIDLLSVDRCNILHLLSNTVNREQVNLPTNTTCDCNSSSLVFYSQCTLLLPSCYLVERKPQSVFLWRYKQVCRWRRDNKSS